MIPSNGCLLLPATKFRLDSSASGKFPAMGVERSHEREKSVTRIAGSRIFARGNRIVMGILFLEC